MDTMNALFYRKHGGPGVDVYDELPKPSFESLKTQLGIKVLAASLNPVDFKQRSGGVTSYLIKSKWPIIHGFDFAGVVISKGSEVKDFDVDDVVFGMVKGVSKGSVAEYMIVESSVCVKIPDGITAAEAASVPLVGITSVLAFRSCGLKENDETSKPRVLILGGAGGVGTCAIQLAKGLYNASFIAVTASPGDKTELCTKLGADLVVNYREDPKLTALAEEEPFDLIYDTVGSLKTALTYVKEGGATVSIAISPTVEGLREWVTDSGETNLAYGAKSLFFSKFGKVVINRVVGATSLRNKLAKRKVTYNHVVGRGNGEIMAILKTELENGNLKPVIDKIYPLKDCLDAMKYLETGKAAGKVVIQIAEA